MRKFSLILVAPVLALGAACGKGSAPAVDDALKADLALASQAQPFNPQQTISPTEAGYAAQNGLAPRAIPASTPRASAPVRRTAAPRRSSGTSRSASGGGGYYPAPAAPPEVIVKHTERDAAIGAVAGAVIGATSSRNKVRGGVIGAAVGGILGGVIGNNVDKQKKSGW